MADDQPLMTEHHILPILTYKMSSSGAYTTTAAGRPVHLPVREPWSPAGIASCGQSSKMRLTVSRFAGPASQRT